MNRSCRSPAAARMFLQNAIQKILAERDIRRKENQQLKKACETALEELKSDDPGKTASVNGGVLPGAAEKGVDAERYFLPFEIACCSRSPRIICIALDCLQKLIAYGHLCGNVVDKTSPDRKMNDRIISTICSAFDKERPEDAVQLHILKAILGVVLSHNCQAHEESLLKAVRVCFNIFLITKDPVNLATSRGILSQVINAVFSTMELHGDEKDDETVVKEVIESLVVRASYCDAVNGSVDESFGDGAASSARGPHSTAGESEQTMAEDSLAFANIYQKDAYLVFRALCILSQKGEGETADAKDNMALRSKVLALEMLLMVLQNSGMVLQTSPPFITLIRRSLCVALSRNAVSPTLAVFEKTLAIFIELLDKFKAKLKLQIEVFFREVILSMLDSPSCTFENRLLLLNAICKVVSVPQSLVDVFVNYDCDLTCHNIFASLVEAVSKTARMPISESTPVVRERDRALRLLGLRCLVEIISCQAEWFCRSVGSEVKREDNTKDDPVQALEAQKQLKDQMEQGIFLFGRKPRDGLRFLQEHGFVGKEPDEVAEFLLREERLDKTVVGDYLGDPDEFNKRVMYAYVDDMDFSSRDLLSSLRMFLEKFRLPGEAQKIDRLMEKFASRYCECNPSLGLFASADTAYVLAYSIILLTTDLHSANVRKKMTKDQYVSMNRGINNGADLPREFLESIYDDISAEEIKMKAGATKLLKSQTTSQGGDGPRRALAHLELAAMSETARILMESVSNSDANFVPASHQQHIRPMFKLCWASALAAFSLGVQQSDDEEEWRLCLRGFHLGCRLACLLHMDTERNAFIQALARFTLLNKRSQMSEMKEKNIEAIKLMMVIGEESGELLKENWIEVLKCVSQLELASLIGTGFGLQSSDQMSSAHYVAKSTGQDQKSLSTLQLALTETASQAVLVAVNRIFERSNELSGEAVLDFVRALCAVSLDDLQQPAGPRMFMLTKIVEVAFYNITRIRLEWSRVWNVIGEHLTAAGCSSKEDISHFAVDALRQLAIKFIERGELPNYRFQKEFLRPFEVIMARNRVAATRELVVSCCSQLVDWQPDRIKSGWINLFSVWTIAATDPHVDIVENAFKSASKVINTQFSANFASVLDAFQEALKCLAEFACNANLPDMSMDAIRLIRQCADCVAANEETIVDAPWEEKFSATGSQRVWLRGWLPIFFELSSIINRCKLDVRTRSLTVLFDILKSHGSTLCLDWWRELFKVVFRIFDHAKQDDNRSDKREWMVTTCNHAMYAVVDVFSQFFPIVGVALLPSIYEKFTFCINQKNEQLARSAVNCLENVVMMNGDAFDGDLWLITVDLICQLLSDTLPRNLLTWGAGGELSRTEASMIVPYDDDYSPPAERRAQEGTNNDSSGNSVKDKQLSDAIVQCVVQSEMVDAVSSIVFGAKKGEVNGGFFSRIEPEQLLRISRALAESQGFARTFNANNGQRTLLWQAGLRGASKPNLSRQETRSLSTLLAILCRLIGDPRAKAFKAQVAELLRVAVVDCLTAFSAAESDSRRSAFSPVVVSMLEECLSLPPSDLSLLGSSFPRSLCQLVVTADTTLMRTKLAALIEVLCTSDSLRVVNGVVRVNGNADAQLP